MDSCGAIANMSFPRCPGSLDIAGRFHNDYIIVVIICGQQQPDHDAIAATQPMVTDVPLANIPTARGMSDLGAFASNVSARFCAARLLLFVIDLT